MPERDEPETVDNEQADDGGENEPQGDQGGDEVEAGGSDQQSASEAPDVVEAEVVEPEPEPSAEDKLRSQLEATQARLRAVSKAYTDLQGEMAAFRERTEHLGKMKAERASFDAVAAFFEPVQNLRRSMDAGSEDLDSLRQGVQMVLHQFTEALRKLGLEEVPAEGADFNPNMHEALAVTPVTDPAQDGKVLMVHQGGYAVNGKVLQAAQVVIGKYEAPAEA